MASSAPHCKVYILLSDRVLALSDGPVFNPYLVLRSSFAFLSLCLAFKDQLSALSVGSVPTEAGDTVLVNSPPTETAVT